MKTLTIALIAALTAGPAFAAELSAPQQRVTVRVSTAGLNLSDPRDVARLRTRVDKAVAAACTPAGNYRAYQVQDEACTGKASGDAERIVADLTRESKVRSAEF